MSEQRELPGRAVGNVISARVVGERKGATQGKALGRSCFALAHNLVMMFSGVQPKNVLSLA